MLRSLVNVLMYGPIKNIHGSNHLRSSTSVDMVINYTHTTSFEFTLILESSQITSSLRPGNGSYLRIRINLFKGKVCCEECMFSERSADFIDGKSN